MKKTIFISTSIVLITYLSFCGSNIILFHNGSSIILENIEALAQNELWNKDKYTELESYTQTRINREEAHYYEKHIIECTKGGVMDSCSPSCKTREVNFGHATPWKPCL